MYLANARDVVDPASLPAGPPPPGVEANFVDPETNIDMTSAIVCTCVSVSTLVVALRMYTKLFVVRAAGRDDWTALVAWVFFAVFFGVSMAAAYIHKELWPQYDLTAGEAGIKNYYLRIFQPDSRRDYFWWLCWGLIIITTLVYVGSTFALIFMCNPRYKIWEPWHTAGSCINIRTLYTFTGIFNAVSDVIILLVPQGKIWRLNTKLKYKLKVSAVFIFAAFTVVCSILRLYFSATLVRPNDPSYTLSAIGVWLFAELAGAFVAACLPSIPKLFRERINPFLKRTFRATGNGESSLSSLPPFSSPSSSSSLPSLSPSWFNCLAARRERKRLEMLEAKTTVSISSSEEERGWPL